MLDVGSVKLWKAVSDLGDVPAMSALCVVLMLVLLAQRRPVMALGCMLIDAGGGLLDQLLKELIRRPRPPGAYEILHRHSWSFPSGHSMGAMVGYGTLVLLLWRYWNVPRAWRLAVTLLAACLVLAVGTSRVALGVHYVSDVLGGWSIGAAWLVATFRLLETLERRKTPASV